MRALKFAWLPLVASILYLLAVSDHPPPPKVPMGYGELKHAETESCALDPAFAPVHHTARRHLVHIFDQLAPAAGVSAGDYSIELIRDRHGSNTINAMTCARSQLIWVSVKAWEELHDHPSALPLLMAHELAHGSSRSPYLLRSDAMSATERQLFEAHTYRQQWEIAADQRAADILLRAGYTKADILAGARYILRREGGHHLLLASYSHPAGWDRVALLGYYLDRAEALVR